MPTTLDGDEITAISINGDDVYEATLDNDVVWKKGDYLYQAGDSQGDWLTSTNSSADYVNFGSNYITLYQESTSTSTSSSRGIARIVLLEEYVNVQQYSEILIEWECPQSNSSNNESSMTYSSDSSPSVLYYGAFSRRKNGIIVSDVDPSQHYNPLLKVQAWGTMNSGDSHTIRVYNIWAVE